jgi:enoyl-CoA hydratase/carnithine racemase
MIPRDYKTILVEKDGAVDWLMLNRPEHLNALNTTLVAELSQYFLDVATDPQVRIVVIKGAGRAFCAGLDLAEAIPPDNFDMTAGLARQRSIVEIVLRMQRAPQAIVSLIQGPACGGGFAIALASDIRVASESARMNAAFIRIGLSACDIGVSYFLPRLVGTSVAFELMMTGAFIDASRALSLGLVSRVVPEAELSNAVRPYLEAMLTTAPLGLRLTKECLRMSIDAPSLEAAVAMEDRNQVLCARSPDFKEGVAAFLEKRRPNYTVAAQ